MQKIHPIQVVCNWVLVLCGFLGHVRTTNETLIVWGRTRLRLVCRDGKSAGGCAQEPSRDQTRPDQTNDEGSEGAWNQASEGIFFPSTERCIPLCSVQMRCSLSVSLCWLCFAVWLLFPITCITLSLPWISRSALFLLCPCVVACPFSVMLPVSSFPFVTCVRSCDGEVESRFSSLGSKICGRM